MKKMITVIISLLLCFCLIFSIYADSESDKDHVPMEEYQGFTLEGYDEMPEELAMQIDGYSGSQYYMKYMYGNNNNSVYVVGTDTEKIGWYVIGNDASIYKLDTKPGSDFFNIDENEYKITDELKDIISNGNEAISVYIWLKDIDSYKENRNYSETRSPEEIRKQVLERRHKAEEAYEAYNRTFVEEYLPELSSDISTFKDDNKNDYSCYISLYAPMIIATASPNIIYELAQIDLVQKIGYETPFEAEDDLSIATQVIQGTYVRDTQGYTGYGAVIGVLEATGIPDVSYSELSSANITIRASDTTVSQHATAVTTIIAGNSLGLAPDATVYAAMTNGNYYSSMEWLLSCGVYAVNCSFSLVNNGIYDNRSMWTDHIDMNHDVLVIKSSGNNGPSIGSPGMAYNAVTVGNFNDNNTLVHTDDYMSASSNYVEVNGYAEKPDLVAPGSNIYFPVYGNMSGTSFSAPLTTGTVAQLIEAVPSLSDQPGQLKSILLASAFRRVSSSNYGSIPYAAWLSDVEGAGKLDSKNAVYVANSSNYTYSYIPLSNFPYYKTFYATANGDKMRVALCWLKQSVLNSGSHIDENNVTDRDLSDLDLELYDPNNNRVDYSMAENGNVEIIEFEPQISGNYKIKVILQVASQGTTQEFIYLAWW